jgi:hypothetical protein
MSRKWHKGILDCTTFLLSLCLLHKLLQFRLKLTLCNLLKAGLKRSPANYSIKGVAAWVATQSNVFNSLRIFLAFCYMDCYMKATNIPYLHCRNGIYYYLNNSVEKSFKASCKKKTFRTVSHILFG